jgi:signal transduction histidine kinase
MQMPITPRQQTPFDIFDVVSYGTLSAGYLLSVITVAHPTLIGFVALTAANIAWVVVYRRITSTNEGMQRTLLIGILVAITSFALAMTKLGVSFDWLMAFVTVGVIASLLAMRPAIIIGSVQLSMTAVILIWLDGGFGAQVARDLTSIVPGYLFVAGFSYMMRAQSVQREHAEALAAEAAAARAALEVAHAQLQAYAASVEELTVTRERNRMAREIHDTLGHYLTILAVQLETATKLEERDDPRLHDELTEARRVATECLAEVRRSVAALRPADPTARSFTEALHHLVAAFEANAPQTEATLDVEGPVQALPTEIRLALYRAAQESLTNIRKHAQATKVLLRLRVEGDGAELTILDNGVGASSTADGHEPGFGLVGMRERVALLGGNATSLPVAGQGWRVDVAIPLHEPLAVTTATLAAPPMSALAEE